MKQLLRIFDNKPVRAVLIKGEPWFVGKDVCEVLGYANANDAMGKHCRGVANRYTIQDRLGREQDVRIINEPDLYRLIIRSNMPAAEAFERWIFEEVLPSIRKYGKYQIDPNLSHASRVARTALTSQWQEHGATAPYHYANLTKKEYSVLGYQKDARKEYMSREQIAALQAFEAIECYKLVTNPVIEGYHGLAESLEETAKILPMIASKLTQEVSA